MSTYYPYLNRGSYKWVPDDYASTSGASFGVTDAYSYAVCNYGRHVNMLAGEDAPKAFGTTVICRGITNGQGALIAPSTTIQSYFPSNVTPSSVKAPFERKIRRGTNLALNQVPFPPVSGGFGFRYDNVNNNPFFFFSTLNLSSKSGNNLQSTNGLGTNRIASVDIEYMLATSQLWENEKGHSATNPPLSILAVLDDSLQNIDSTWLGAERGISETTDAKGVVTKTSWGPASAQEANDPHSRDVLNAIQSTIGSGTLHGYFLPMYIYAEDQNGAKAVSTYPELSITNQGAYSGTSMDWGITARRSINIKLSGTYWINLEYFPRLVGFIIMPNWRVFPGPNPMNPQIPSNPWNAVISGLRVYDALQANAVPEHINNNITVSSQLPCEVFGYSWRISHPVAMSTYTASIQPSRGTKLSDFPGTGLGDRLSTFYFKIYHPDIAGLGIAHGVRFYYGLAVLAIPGTSPILGTTSVATLLVSLALDQDLLFVQYTGIKPGTQTLTFQFGLSQYGNVGKTVYSGDLSFSKETVGVRCGWAAGSSTSAPSNATVSTLTWADLSNALPSGLTNGTKVLFYDNDVNISNRWYSFASMNAFGVQQFDATTFGTLYTGGLTPFIHGAPQTNLAGPGAFGMSVSSSSSFVGPEKMTVYAKPRQYASGTSISEICSDNNNHLSTFVSEVRNIGPDIYIYGGTWRIRVVATTGSTLKMNSQVFFRFFFIPEIYNGETTDLSTINGSGILSVPHFEFHFERRGGNYYITPGTPNISDIISTPLLTDQATAYDLSWDAYDGDTSSSYISVLNMDDLFQRRISIHLGSALPLMQGTRLVVQAWAANYSNTYSGTTDYYKPETDLNYPAVELSWSGTTESMFQTMIAEVKSDAILAQQDPFVAGESIASYNMITTFACSASDESVKARDAAIAAQDAAKANGTTYIPPPYRDYPLWANKISFSNGKITPFSNGSGGYEALSTIGALTNGSITNGGRMSLEFFSVPEVSDLIEEQAQIVDFAVYRGENYLESIIGGTTIGPTQFIVSFAYLTNNSTYNIRYSLELLAVSSDSITTYPIALSDIQIIDSSGNSDGTLQYSGNASFTMLVNQAILVPDPNAKLMVRFRFWPNKNRAMTTGLESSISSAAKGFQVGFTCLDIDGFQVTMKPFDNVVSSGTSTIDVVTGALKQRGSSDWYEGLPATTSRTFGSADYYFVADEDSLKTAIMPPLTTTQYGYWFLYGWLFSPFWFLQMPEGACIEIKDDAGITNGNPVSGSNIDPRERAQKVMMFRTAVGTLPLANVSSDMENARMSGQGVLARQRLEISGSASASNFLSVMQGVQSSQAISHGATEYMVRIGDSIVSGKNPLILTGSPNRKRAQYFYKGNPSTSYLFYEEDTFDSTNHASVVMLANYDGTFSNWHNPYGKRSSGTTDKTVFTNDMRLIGAAVDPMDFGVYLAGFRTNNLSNPSEGGTIVLKKLQPGMVFGTDSAHVGPIRIVDGLVTDQTYNVTALADVQPVVPLGLTTNIGNRLNTLGDSNKPLPAAESFPDVMVDNNGMVYVFYTLIANSPDEKKKALGKIFCRESSNAGYWFDTPFPVADLGYERALLNGVSADSSFEAKHVTVIYTDETKTFSMFFWANGKIFMRILPHPGINMDRFRLLTPGVDGKPENIMYSDDINMLYMVEGDTSFTDGRISSGLDQWLKNQWDAGENMSDGEMVSMGGNWYSSSTSYSVSGKSNNFKSINNKIPGIRILKYSNASDVPAQRVGAVINSSDEILLYYIDSVGNVVYKKIILSSSAAIVSPGLIVSTNTL